MFLFYREGYPGARGSLGLPAILPGSKLDPSLSLSLGVGMGERGGLPTQCPRSHETGVLLHAT